LIWTNYNSAQFSPKKLGGKQKNKYKINLRISTMVAWSQHQARLENLGINTKLFEKFQYKFYS